MARAIRDEYLFHFTLRELEPWHRTQERLSPTGHWLPPRPLYHNRILVDDRDPMMENGQRGFTFGYHNYTYYSYNVATGRLVERRQPIPLETNLIVDRQASMYYSQGHIYTLNYAANEYAVGNGQEQNEESSSDDDTDAEGEETEHVRFDWEMMHFRHLGSGESWLDYVGNQQSLSATRRGQTWPYALLPDAYLPHADRRNVRNRHAPYGSLHGNLAMLIGLTALTADPNAYNVHNTLMETVRGTDWTLPVQEQQRPPGWRNRRGLVIKLWTTPESAHDCRSYEHEPLFR